MLPKLKKKNPHKHQNTAQATSGLSSPAFPQLVIITSWKNHRIKLIPVQLNNIDALSVLNSIVTDMTVSTMLSDTYHRVISTEWMPEKVPEAKRLLPSDKSLNFLQFLADNPHRLGKRTKINLRNRIREQQKEKILTHLVHLFFWARTGQTNLSLEKNVKK